MRRFVIVAALFAATFLSAACANAQPAAPINTGTLLRQLYGIQNAPNCYQQSVSVGNGATRILPNKASRAVLFITNADINAAWVLPDNSVTNTHGFELAAGGGTLSLNFRDDMLLPTLEWWANANGNTPTLTIWECDLQ